MGTRIILDLAAEINMAASALDVPPKRSWLEIKAPLDADETLDDLRDEPETHEHSGYSLANDMR